MQMVTAFLPLLLLGITITRGQPWSASTGQVFSLVGNVQTEVQLLGRRSSNLPKTPTVTPTKIIIGCYDSRNNEIEGRIKTMMTCQDMFNWAINVATDDSTCTDTSGVPIGGIRASGFEPSNRVRGSLWPGFDDRVFSSWGRGFSGRKRRRRKRRIHGTVFLRKKRQWSAWPETSGRQIGSKVPTGPSVPLDETLQGTSCQRLPDVGNCDEYGYRVNSLYMEFEIKNVLVVASNGIPIHEYHHASQAINPTAACERYRVMLLPKKPNKYEDYRLRLKTSPGSPIGISRSGAFIFSPSLPKLANNGCDIAMNAESQYLDGCGGYSDENCHYHYHSAPSSRCLSKSDCVLLGYLRDGFPIYSQCNGWKSCYIQESNGTRSGTITVTGCSPKEFQFSEAARGRNLCDLDESNGRIFNDQYSYFLTPNFPFIAAKYAGPVYKMCTIIP